MKFTPENLIENIDKIGPWSIYGLAVEALRHYFPEKYEIIDYDPSVMEELEMVNSLGCECWQDLIIKYQKENGYDALDGFDEGFVNEN